MDEDKSRNVDVFTKTVLETSHEKMVLKTVFPRLTGIKLFEWFQKPKLCKTKQSFGGYFLNNRKKPFQFGSLLNLLLNSYCELLY